MQHAASVVYYLSGPFYVSRDQLGGGMWRGAMWVGQSQLRQRTNVLLTQECDVEFLLFELTFIF